MLRSDTLSHTSSNQSYLDLKRHNLIFGGVSDHSEKKEGKNVIKDNMKGSLVIIIYL